VGGLSEGRRYRSWFTLDLQSLHRPLDDCIHETPEGDLAVAAGSFGFRGRMGPSALAAFLEGFDGTWRQLSETTGQFVILLHKDGRIWVSSDRGNMAHVYLDTRSGAVSSSYLMLGDAGRPHTVDRLSLLERLYLGSTTGERTVFREIDRLPAAHAIEMTPDAMKLTALDVASQPSSPRSFRDAVDDVRSRLIELFTAYRTMHPGRITTPLTGGFDSRLIVAVLRAVGATPDLLVYGGASDIDVRIAKNIAAVEGLTLDHIDKSEHPTPSADEFPAVLEESFVTHDGRGTLGVFGNGSDIPSRIRRAADGAMYLNGGGGEIYRNFWKVLNAGTTVIDFLHHRYERIDRRALRDPADWNRMLERLADAYADLVGAQDGCLTREQIDGLYVRQRIRYWMSPDNQVNNLFGPAMLPFSEPALTEPSLRLPVPWRENGRFQAALITSLDAGLASYPSAYGWSFDAVAPLKTRLRTWLKLRIPTFIRRRYQRRAYAQLTFMPERPFWAQSPWREAVFEDRPLRISEYVDVEAIHGKNQLNRAFTLELLLRRFT
ncbi:hypothetical protein KKG45_11155, partial [bacterium]|nr:hypothetical protein [bacterium]